MRLFSFLGEKNASLIQPYSTFLPDEYSPAQVYGESVLLYLRVELLQHFNLCYPTCREPDEHRYGTS